MKILVTAFEPFGGELLNSSREALTLADKKTAGADIVKLILPVVFGESARLLERAVQREAPDAVLCLGEAGGRGLITPERVAINLEDARIPDNAGVQPKDRPVEPGGPDVCFSTLPVKRMALAIREAGLPASVSLSAGSFVCNHLMYSLLRFCRKEYPRTRAGFMHLPLLTAQAAAKTPPLPGFEAEDLARGIEAAIEAIAQSLREEIGPSS